MKTKIVILLISLSLVLSVIPVNPTQSQKKEDVPSDTVPEVKTEKSEAKPDSILPVTNPRLDSAVAKAAAVIQVLDKDDKRADRMKYQLTGIQTKQVKLFMAMVPSPVIELPILKPKQSIIIQVDPAQPEILPIEPAKESWWRKVFNRK